MEDPEENKGEQEKRLSLWEDVCYRAPDDLMKQIILGHGRRLVGNLEIKEIRLGLFSSPNGVFIP